MNEINELPLPSTYGHDFNYSQWTANTQITLCNVPWGNSYRDIWFAQNMAALNDYLDYRSGPTINLTKVTYHRPGQPIRLPIPYGKALGFNYLRAYNPPQPGQDGDVGRSYYYFIGGVSHISPGATEFMLQLDVISSYIHEVKFGNCYIQQGHIGVANERQMDDFGKEFLSIPEGLDIGADYQIAYVYSRSIASARNTDSGYSIMVVSTIALDEEPGDVKNPKFKTATGNGLENLPNGAEVYVFNDRGEFNEFLNVYKDKPWITQGIISITAIPDNLGIEYGMKSVSKRVSGIEIKEVQPGPLKTVRRSMGSSWRLVASACIPQRYRHLDKMLVAPYTMLEMTTNTGTPIALKPEAWASPDMDVVEVPHFAQPGPRMMFYPYRYNAGPLSSPQTDKNGVVNDGGEFLDLATGIFNFPTFSLVNNSYMSFMASNANSLAYQHSSADWSQQRALAGNQVGYNQASAGIGTSNELTGIGIDSSRQQANISNQTAALQGVRNATAGALGSLGAGNPAGAVGAIAGSFADRAISITATEASFANSSNTARRSNTASTDNMAYTRDTNYDYANMAAKGDYQNTIAGINAKVQDAQLIPPTTAGQVGGEAFMLAQYRWGYDVKVKMMQPGPMSRMGEYWLRYGYAIQRFGKIPASLQVMTHFTYWKLSETYLFGNIPENFKETIRGIFENGVTVWADPGYIGNIDMGINKPLKGVRFE